MKTPNHWVKNTFKTLSNKIPTKNKLPFLTLGFTLAAIVLTVISVQQQQTLTQEAAVEDCVPTDNDNSVAITRGPTVKVTIRHEDNPPAVINTGNAKVKGQVVVRYKAGKPKNTVDQKVRKRNGKLKKRVERVRLDVIEVPAGEEQATIQELQSDPNVEFVEQANYIFLGAVPNDPRFKDQWYLDNRGQSGGKVDADVDAPEAWDKVRGNSSVKIAILDSGIDKSHPELQGKVVAEKNFVQGTNMADNANHGTAVAGIAAAKGNNNQGISGMCPECSLLNGKVFDPNGQGTDATLAEAISWAMDNGAKVISMSVGTPYRSQILESVVKEAVSAKIVLVALAGNCGNDDFAMNNCTQKNQTIYPGAYDGVISVAALDHNDQLASFSNHGPDVDLAAPGVNILTIGTNNSYSAHTGTSDATPIVSGLTGLLFSQGLDYQQVITKLLNTTDRINGTGTNFRYGRINAAKAVGGTAATPTGTVTANPTNTKPTSVTGKPGTTKLPKPTCRPQVNKTPAPSRPVGEIIRDNKALQRACRIFPRLPICAQLKVNDPCPADPNNGRRNSGTGSGGSNTGGKSGTATSSNQSGQVTMGRINSDDSSNTTITVNGRQISVGNQNTVNNDNFNDGDDINSGGKTGGNNSTTINIDRSGGTQVVDRSGNNGQKSNGGNGNQNRPLDDCDNDTPKNGGKNNGGNKNNPPQKKPKPAPKKQPWICTLVPFLEGCNRKNVKGAAISSTLDDPAYLIESSILYSCMSDENRCTAEQRKASDRNHDGEVNIIDYEIAMSEAAEK